MKIAILLAGPYRGNQTIIENHKKLIGEYDTFVSCFEHYREDWINSGWPIKELFTTPYIDFKETNWSKYRDDAAGQSGFWQFWNLRNVIKNTPNHYDWYIKNRCDLIFDSGQITEYLFTTLDENTLYCPTTYFDGRDWDYTHLLNDQFYIGDYKTMSVISEFVTEFYKTNRHGLNEAGPFIGSNESSLRLFLNENNINIKSLNDIKYRKDHNGVTIVSGASAYQLEKIEKNDK